MSLRHRFAAIEGATSRVIGDGVQAESRVVQVRARRDEDLDALVTLAARVHATDRYLPFLPDRDFARFLITPRPLAAWVAVHRGRLVGHVALNAETSRAVMALVAELTLGRRGAWMSIVGHDDRPYDAGAVTDDTRVRWAPMLPAAKLIRLYEANAAALLDDELLDDVGWRLWERLSDVVRVTNGRVRCPSCGAEFQVRAPDRSPDEVVSCPGCDWTITPRTWHKSWEHRDLNGPCPEFQRYVDGWPAVTSSRDRMLLIDTVVHALHVASRVDIPGNFAARNFLEGSRPKIVALLDELAYGPGSHVVEGARARWQAARDHYRSSRVSRP